MYHIQEFMINHICGQPNGKRTILPPIVFPKEPARRNFSVPDYESCMMDCFNKRSTGDNKVNSLSEKQGDLTRDKYEVGYFVSNYQFICNTPGLLTTGYDKESSD